LAYASSHAGRYADTRVGFLEKQTEALARQLGQLSRDDPPEIAKENFLRASFPRCRSNPKDLRERLDEAKAEDSVMTYAIGSQLVRLSRHNGG